MVASLSPSRGGTFSFLGTEIMIRRGVGSSPVRPGAEVKRKVFGDEPHTNLTLTTSCVQSAQRGPSSTLSPVGQIYFEAGDAPLLVVPRRLGLVEMVSGPGIHFCQEDPSTPGCRQMTSATRPSNWLHLPVPDQPALPDLLTSLSYCTPVCLSFQPLHRPRDEWSRPTLPSVS